MYGNVTASDSNVLIRQGSALESPHSSRAPFMGISLSIARNSHAPVLNLDDWNQTHYKVEPLHVTKRVPDQSLSLETKEWDQLAEGWVVDFSLRISAQNVIPRVLGCSLAAKVLRKGD